MALINCPECGKEVSDQSDRCINCGYPIKKKVHEEYINNLKDHEKNNQVPCSRCGTWNEVGSTYCRSCGKVITGTDYEKFNHMLGNTNSTTNKSQNALPVLLLVISIFSFIFAAFMLLQSCSVGLLDSIGVKDDNSGSAGLVLSFCYISSGVIAIVCGKREQQRYLLVSTIYALGGLLGLSARSEYYKDLQIWSSLSLIFSFIFACSAFMKYRKNKSS